MSTSAYYILRLNIYLASGIISSCASFCNLFLILDMNSWTSHTRLIFLMTTYQLLYDITYFFQNESSFGVTANTSFIIINRFGGTTSTFVSNVMMFTVLYIVRNKKAFRHNFYISIVHILSLLPSLFVTIAYMYGFITSNANAILLAEESYTYIRIISVVLNILPYTYMSYLLHIAKIKSSGREKSIQEKAIEALVERLKFYPLIQALARIFPSWYELTYGYDYVSATMSSQQYAMTCAVALFLPLASIGNLIAFLIMQPKSFLFLQSRLCHCRRYSAVSNAAMFFLARVSNVPNNSNPIASFSSAPLFTSSFMHETNSTIDYQIRPQQISEISASSISTFNNNSDAQVYHDMCHLDESQLVDLLNSTGKGVRESHIKLSVISSRALSQTSRQNIT